MPENKSSEFIVRLDGLKLSADVEARINGEIQAVVMREVAKIDFRGDLVSRIPRGDWNGIWTRTKAFEVNNSILKVNEVKR